MRSVAAVVGVVLLAGATVAMAALPPGGTFRDDDGNVHEGYIEAIAAQGITKGCNPPQNDRYCPSDPVTRGQMAAFLVRALDLGPASGDQFSDDSGSVFEDDINRLASAGITKGCNPPQNDHYCPTKVVSRGQMAAFLVRALGYTDNGGGNLFTDDDSSVFENDIDRLATAGVTKGCNPPQNDHYCPTDPVRRDQMASFLGRALHLTANTPPPTSPTSTTTGNSAPANLLVIGDFGNGSSAEDQVAAQMHQAALATPIDAFVTTGDNMYRTTLSDWTGPFGWVDDAGIPVYAAWGNHDIESPEREAVVQQALNPPGRWYSERIGPANLVVLDANDPTNPDQLAWLDGTLASLPAGPTMVSFHQPAYSCGGHGNTAEVDQLWVPRFESAGIDLVLNGHDHDYQSFQKSGVTYVVTGGGGAGLRNFSSCKSGTPSPIVSDDSHHHFLLVHVTANSIHVQAITDGGQMLDDFTLATG